MMGGFKEHDIRPKFSLENSYLGNLRAALGNGESLGQIGKVRVNMVCLKFQRSKTVSRTLRFPLALQSNSSVNPKRKLDILFSTQKHL